MSYNTEPERAARRHPAALIAIFVALVVAGLAFFWWVGADPEEEGDVSRIESSEAPEGGAVEAAPERPAQTAPTPATPAPSTTAPAGN